MKTAVIYYSLEGNTRSVAETVAQALQADRIHLIPVKAYPDKGVKKFLWGGKAAVMKEMPELEPYQFDAEDYKTVVLCTPVWAGTFTPPFRTFLSRHDLRGKRVAIIACSSGGNAGKCISQLQSAAGVDSLAAQLSLVDPKDRPTSENEARIREFIQALQ